jgi:predicted nucleic acid-binding protein
MELTYRRFTIIASDVKPASRLCSDPGDEYLLALAVVQDVDYLISGDPHLIRIKNFPIPIVSPCVFVDRLVASS